MQKRKTYIGQRFICWVAVMTMMICSCKKMVEVKAPSTSINSGNVFANDATAIAAVTDIYATISRTELMAGGIASVSLFPSLSSDELSLFNGSTNNAVNYYYKNQLSDINISNPDFWTSFYHTIYITNTSIAELNQSTTLTPVIKTQLLGEAKFMRAFCYFYLVNLYGDVPLVLTTDYKINSIPTRTAKDKVYDQIVADLKDAQNSLSSNYLDATLTKITGEKLRPSRWAATALLARVYLYNRDFANAEIQASTLINSGLFSLPALNTVFKMNSSEAIWELQPVITGWNTQDARVFILPSSGPDNGYYYFYLSPQLMNSFENSDQRKTTWVNSVTVGGTTYYYPYKYKSATYNAPVTEYKMVFRLAEQYLIRAEARAQQGDLTGAAADLNAIRNRAGLDETSAATQTTLVSAILHEKQVELFSEWGHRWLDLKRTGKVNEVMSIVTPQKGGTWNANWQWYPLPFSDLQQNSRLQQNRPRRVTRNEETRRSLMGKC